MPTNLKSIIVGLSAGFLSGLLGLGGGIIFVPALIFFLGRTQHQAHGTSLALIVPTALVGSSVYAFHGNFDLSLAMWIAIFAMGAAYFGAGFANKLSPDKLRLIYAVFLFLVGIKLIIG
ncbi:MAG: sulfite exporter TauE/SafE family protein [Candidatus Margulisiibacteriota bacterium]